MVPFGRMAVMRAVGLVPSILFRRSFTCIGLLALCVTPAPARADGDGPVPEGIRTQIERLREHGAVTLHGELVYNSDGLASFYERRGFEPAWTRKGAIDELVAGITSIERDGLRAADYHPEAIARAIANRDQICLDVLATDALVRLLTHLRKGKVDPASLNKEWNLEARADTTTLPELLDVAFLGSSITRAIDQQRPTHFIYEGLVKTLADYRALEARGGWSPIAPGPKLAIGAVDARVVALRRRLAATGDLPATASRDANTFDVEVETALKAFQDRHRLTADGAVGKATLDALNVPVAARIDQIRANLERARWVLGGLGDSFVLVNLPAFKVYVIRNKQLVWETRTQVGKTARQTPMFRADMRYLVLNPTWTVPPTIFTKDILPSAKKDPKYLAKRGLVAVDRNGRPVDPATIDWSKAATRFPYSLEQAAGRDNALGRVKFIFPNPYAIFLHDTPHREFFGNDERTFSSGCIRVEKPLELASVLLTGTEWTPEKIQQAVDTGKTQTVLLDEPLPVVIVYWTVSVGTSGLARFARDVYGYDPRLVRALDAPVQRAVTWR